MNQACLARFQAVPRAGCQRAALLRCPRFGILNFIFFFLDWSDPHGLTHGTVKVRLNAGVLCLVSSSPLALCTVFRSCFCPFLNPYHPGLAWQVSSVVLQFLF